MPEQFEIVFPNHMKKYLTNEAQEKLTTIMKNSANIVFSEARSIAAEQQKGQKDIAIHSKTIDEAYWNYYVRRLRKKRRHPIFYNVVKVAQHISIVIFGFGLNKLNTEPYWALVGIIVFFVSFISLGKMEE